MVKACLSLLADQILHHAPGDSRLAPHGAHQLPAEDASGLGDTEGRLQDSVCPGEQVRLRFGGGFFLPSSKLKKEWGCM